jgi:hypothetical protein
MTAARVHRGRGNRLRGRSVVGGIDGGVCSERREIQGRLGNAR